MPRPKTRQLPVQSPDPVPMIRRITPFDDPVARTEAGVMGMLVFIVSLAMIFAATILGLVVVRIEDEGPWPPAGMPALPSLLGLSTAVILLSSLTMWFTTRAIARDRLIAFRRWLWATFLLGLAFLILQIVSWSQVIADDLDFESHLYAWTFYVLTALHALHVLGGIGPMGLVVANAGRGRYRADRHRGVTYVAMYWHFLDLAWVSLYATLAWGTWFRS